MPKSWSSIFPKTENLAGCAAKADVPVAGARPAREADALPGKQMLGRRLENVVAAARHALAGVRWILPAIVRAVRVRPV